MVGKPVPGVGANVADGYGEGSGVGARVGIIDGLGDGAIVGIEVGKNSDGSCSRWRVTSIINNDIDIAI